MSNIDAEENRLTEYLAGYISLTYDPGENSFEILSTIRYDPTLTEPAASEVESITKQNFFLFDEHFHRLDYTLNYFLKGSVPFEITPDLLFNKLVESIKEAGVHSDISVETPKKIRLLVNLDGEIRIELYEVAPKDGLLAELDSSKVLVPWDVYLDSETMLPSPFTSFKTTNRTHYTAARERMLPGLNPGHEEVIVFNSFNKPMEGSITNIAVRKGPFNEWVTPTLTSGCLCGVLRNHLLRKQFVKEGELEKEDLKVGTEVLLFNGVMGVVRGVIREAI